MKSDARPMREITDLGREIITRIMALGVQRRPLFMERRVTDQLLVGGGYTLVSAGQAGENSGFVEADDVIERAHRARSRLRHVVTASGEQGGRLSPLDAGLLH